MKPLFFEKQNLFSSLKKKTAASYWSIERPEILLARLGCCWLNSTRWGAGCWPKWTGFFVETLKKRERERERERENHQRRTTMAGKCECRFSTTTPTASHRVVTFDFRFRFFLFEIETLGSIEIEFDFLLWVWGFQSSPLPIDSVFSSWLLCTEMDILRMFWFFFWFQSICTSFYLISLLFQIWLTKRAFTATIPY